MGKGKDFNSACIYWVDNGIKWEFSFPAKCWGRETLYLSCIRFGIYCFSLFPLWKENFVLQIITISTIINIFTNRPSTLLFIFHRSPPLSVECYPCADTSSHIPTVVVNWHWGIRAQLATGTFWNFGIKFQTIVSMVNVVQINLQWHWFPITLSICSCLPGSWYFAVGGRGWHRVHYGVAPATWRGSFTGSVMTGI